MLGLASPVGRQGTRASAHRLRAVTLLSALGLVLTATRETHAFRTGSDLPDLAGTERVRWASRALSFSLYEESPRGLELAEVEIALTSALSVWRALDCAAPQLSYGGSSSLRARPNDGVNTIEWIAAGWRGLGLPADGAASTDVHYARNAAGEWGIVEADIYVNAENFTWTIGASAEGARDVESVLAHELGHAIGLLHPCELDGADGAPLCSANAGYRSSLMYPVTSSGNVELSPDDSEGVCYLYTSAGAAGPGLPGDPCSSTDECRSGVCNEAGHCERACSSQSQCSAEQTCTPQGRASICTGKAEPLGAACTKADECLGGQCLTGTESGPVCTRACDANSPCPSGWSCDDVDGQRVCAPPSANEGGCQIVRARTNQSARAAVALLSALFASFSVRRSAVTRGLPRIRSV